MTTLRAVIVVLVLLAGAAGCATGSGARLGYASWNHLTFSMRTAWQQFVGWSPVSTTDDEAAAAREGGWWGDEVPVLPAR